MNPELLQPIHDERQMAALRLDAVGAGYGKKEILRGVSLTIETGQIVTLVGANGAGKSTLLKATIGLLHPWRGAVYLADTDVTALPVHRRVRHGLGYLLQGGQVFPSLTVWENLQMGARVSPTADRAKAFETVLETIPSLRDRLSTRAGLLSGGQRQALALGMVLAQQPRTLLLDEPSAGLSPKLAQEMLTTVRRLNERLGVTVLLVEQRVREALEVAHRAVALVNGAVAAETTSPEQWLLDGALDPYFFGSAQQGTPNLTKAGMV